MAACDVESPPRECALRGGAASLRIKSVHDGVEPQRFQYRYMIVVVIYKPHSLPLTTEAANHNWQRHLARCTATAPEVLFRGDLRQAKDLAAVTDLGALLECVEACLAEEGRHHKGLLSFYPQQPLPDRYLPSMRDWNQGHQLARYQSHGRVLGCPIVVMTFLHYPDTRASCGSQANQQGYWQRRHLPFLWEIPSCRPPDVQLQRLHDADLWSHHVIALLELVPSNVQDLRPVGSLGLQERT